MLVPSVPVRMRNLHDTAPMLCIWMCLLALAAAAGAVTWGRDRFVTQLSAHT